MKKIIWIDDNYSEFERLQQKFTLMAQQEFDIVYYDLQDILDESGAVLENLLNLLEAEQSIVLLDWNDGQIGEFYPSIKEITQYCLLVSWNSHEELKRQGAFDQWPEFEENFLQKQISAFRLLEKIDELEKNSESEVYQGFGANPVASDVMQIHDLLAIRFLNENFQAIAVTDGWKMDRDKPLIQFDENQKSDLIQGVMVQQNLFTTLPNEPDKFGPAQFFTKKLPSVEKNAWPELAVYYQKAFALPSTGLGLEEFGKSADGIIELMRQAGFARGRFYFLTKIPGYRGLFFELISRFPDEDGNLPLPITKEIDEIEHKILHEYKNEYEKNRRENNKKKLIYKIVDAHQLGGNDDFWSLYIKSDDINFRLEVPVFLVSNELNKNWENEYFDLMGIRGVFVFDRGNRDVLAEKHVRALEPTLLSAINYFNIAREKECDFWENKLSRNLFNLHKKFVKIERKGDLLREMLAYLLNLDDLSQNKHIETVRSASFAEYDAGKKILQVVCETDETAGMNGFEFSLEQNFFVIVQCANKFLNGEDTPVIDPNFDFGETAMKKRREEFGKIKQCRDDPDVMEKCLRKIKMIRSVVGFPVYIGDELLGVLVLSSTLLHDFTLRWINSISGAIEVATPYLQRFKNEAKRRNSWDSLVMHEMRANLTWAMAKLDFLQHAKDKNERLQSTEDLMHVLQDGSSLSSLFLQWLGNQDNQLERPTDEEFWLRLNKYGSFRQRSSERLKWKFSIDPKCIGIDAVQYERALRILIDNAFRYASGNGDVVSCEIFYSNDRKHIQAQITNPGQLINRRSGHVLMPEELGATAPGDFKAKVGLSLVAMLCRKVGSPMPMLYQDNTDHEYPKVTSLLFWPIFHEERI